MELKKLKQLESWHKIAPWCWNRSAMVERHKYSRVRHRTRDCIPQLIKNARISDRSRQLLWSYTGFGLLFGIWEVAKLNLPKSSLWSTDPSKVHTTKDQASHFICLKKT